METQKTSSTDIVLYVIASIFSLAFLNCCIQLLSKSYYLFVFTYNAYNTHSKLINPKYFIGLSLVGIISVLICILLVSILLDRSKFPTYISIANDLKALSNLFKK
jgi:hypothetical protein